MNDSCGYVSFVTAGVTHLSHWVLVDFHGESAEFI
jgi:hypothetical protein